MTSYHHFSYTFIWLQSLHVMFTLASEGKIYQPNEEVTLFVNKVGPYHNPHETYHYYELPVCRPKVIDHKTLSLGEVLDGDRMAFSLYVLNFGKNVPVEVLCKYKLTAEDLEKLKNAVEDSYYFEFVIDSIPVHGFVGKVVESGFLPHSHKLYLYTHTTFEIEYNGNRIIYATVIAQDSASNKLQEPAKHIDLDTLKEGHEIEYTYSVIWTAVTTEYSKRGDLIRHNVFFPKSLEIHWLSIINSVVLVSLLVVFVFVILSRILKKDFAKYNIDQSEDDEQEYGWKIIHADVFRHPAHRSIFASILGVGSQFLVVVAGIIIMGLLQSFSVHNHGSINVSAVFLYAFTSCIAGYVSANMYKKLGGKAWVWNINLTATLFAGPLCLVWGCINSIAWYKGTTLALPFTTVLILGCVWLVIGFPLTVIGGIIGKNMATTLEVPCRTRNIAREVPYIPWYKGAIMQYFAGGFLPFSAISVELYYIYATIWMRQHYTLFGILIIVFCILIAVTACVNIALTYFQLMMEDYRWWWRSLLSSGAIGFFVFLYSVFFYFVRSNMSGFMQFTEFFGYTLLICYVFFLTFGTVGFLSSLVFVRYIYYNVKMD